MIIIDIIIIVLFLLLTATIVVAIWSGWKNRKDSGINSRHLAFISGITFLLMLIGFLLLPVHGTTQVLWERVANMFLLTIGGLTLILLFIAGKDLLKH